MCLHDRVGRRAVALASGIVCALGVVRPAVAASSTWTNSTGNFLWSDQGNWTNGIPGLSDTATFVNGFDRVNLAGTSPAVGAVRVFADDVGTLGIDNGLLHVDRIDAFGPSIRPEARIAGTVAANRSLLTLSNTAVYGSIGDGAGGGSFGVAGDRNGLSFLLGHNTYRGATMGAIQVLGSVRNSPLIWVTGGVAVDSRASNGDAVADPAEVRLDGGGFALVTPASGERVGAVTIQRANDVWFGDQVPLLRCASLTRSAGGAVLLNDNIFGSRAAAPSTPWRWIVDIPPALAGDGSSTPSHRGILPGFAARDNNHVLPLELMTYDTNPDPAHPGDAIGVRRLTGAEYLHDDLSPAAQNANVRLGAAHNLASPLTVNSVLLDDTAVSLSLADAATLTVASGVLTSVGDCTLDGAGGLLFPGEGIITSFRLADFNVPIRAESLTVTGRVALHRANVITAGVNANRAEITVDADGALGSGPMSLSDSTLLVPFTWSLQHPLTIGGNSSISPSGIHTNGTFLLDAPLLGNGTLHSPYSLILRGGGEVQKMHIDASNVALVGTFNAPTPQDLTIVTEGTLSGNATVRGSAMALNMEPGAENGGAGGSVGRLVLDHFAGDSEDGRYIPAYRFDLLGDVAGISYDQLVVRQGIDISGGELGAPAFLILRVGFAPTLGEEFLLIDNQGPDAVGGRFVQPEGFIFNRGGYWFRMSYVGGDGNDVVVTVVPEPAATIAAFVIAVGAIRRRRLSRPPRDGGLTVVLTPCVCRNRRSQPCNSTSRIVRSTRSASAMPHA